MLERGQVFVRGLKADGKMGPIDALDLDEESFRRFILELLANQCLVLRQNLPEDFIETPLKEKRVEYGT